MAGTAPESSRDTCWSSKSHCPRQEQPEHSALERNSVLLLQKGSQLIPEQPETPSQPCTSQGLTSAQHWPLAHPNRPARCMLTSREMCQWWGVHWQPKGKIRARAGHFGTSHCHWTQIPPSPSCRNGPSPEIPGCKPRGAGLIP